MDPQYLKVKETAENQSNQKLLPHYQHEKISSIHKLTLNIQQNFRTPRNLRSCLFLTMLTKKSLTFSFPEFVQTCKKSVYSIRSFLKYSQFQNPVTKLATPIFDHAQPKIFDQL